MCFSLFYYSIINVLRKKIFDPTTSRHSSRGEKGTRSNEDEGWSERVWKFKNEKIQGKFDASLGKENERGTRKFSIFPV